MNRRFSTSGFTLIELMVVIGVVATLMVLLLPAINSAIEAGRRTLCGTKTTRLALAMTEYDSRQGFLPGIRNKLAIKSPGGSGLRIDYSSALAPGAFPMPDSSTNWFVMILPHLELTGVFNEVVEGKIWVGSAGMGSASAHKNLTRAVTECPSRGDFYTLAYSYQNMHYRANGSSVNRNDGAIGDNANGIFVGLADVAAGDGTSSTLLIAEGRRESWYPNTWTSIDTGTSAMIGKQQCGAFRGYGGHNFTNLSPVHPDLGGTMLFGFPSSGTPTATTRILNVTGGSASYPSSAEGSFGNQASGVHLGGANVAFVDGSCKFLRDDLLPRVCGHLLTHRSTWTPITATTGTYATNSAVANGFLQCLPATKPYTLRAQDY